MVVVVTCQVCAGMGSTRQDYFPSPVWSCCPNCNGLGQTPSLPQ